MLDFEKEFSNFTGGSNGSSIKEIYTLIPSLSQEQIEIIMQLKYLINEYELDILQNMIIEYITIQKQNKNLSFLKNTTLKNLMRAYTQEEFIRGVKIQRMNNPED